MTGKLSTGLQATVEQWRLYHDQRRLDIVVADFSEGRSLHLDFSATHPCLPSNIATSSHTVGAAAAKREWEKQSLYNDCQGIFIPVVCENHGRWGEAAMKLLKTLSSRAAETTPQLTKAQFTDFWTKKLSCKLLQGTMATIAGNAAGWHQNSSLITSLIDYITHHPTP